MNYSLRDITSLLGSVDMLEDQRSLKGISIDSRNIESGMLFWAIKGDRYDGHDFVQSALDKGACGAVVHQDFQLPNAENLIHVEDTLNALHSLANDYRKRLGIPVIAITGTNGKTTTKEMLVSILKTTMKTATSQGNFNNHIGVPLSILTWPDDAEIGVLEMGMNHLGEINTLCQIAEPTHGIITNIGKGHLEFLKDVAGVAKAKGELLEYLNSKGTAFLNGDDEWLITMRNLILNSVLFGFSDSCSVQATDIENSTEAITFKVQNESIWMPVIGEYNVSNALAAIAAARHFKISWDHIRLGLENFEPVQQRMQIIQAGNIQIINDVYNANPTSMKNALMTLNEFPVNGRKIAVLGDMAELGQVSEAEHIRIGQLVKELNLDGFWSYGPLMQYAFHESQRVGFTNTHHFENHKDLTEHLLSNIQKGDVILIKGSRSSRMETVVSLLESDLMKEGK